MSIARNSILMSESVAAFTGADSFVVATIRDYATIVKPGVLLLVVFSGATGLWLAPADMHFILQFVTLLCIALGSAAGAIFNMIYDRDIDSIMHRTRNRPLVTGVINAEDAMIAGILLAIMAVGLLGVATNWFAAILLAVAIFYYAVIYTIWLKRYTAQNIVIGGAAGAFPPVIGWVAATGEISAMAVTLFAIIFLWTPPHFWALALFRNSDYKRASIPMLPVISGPKATSLQMLIYSLLLLPVTLLPLALAPDILGWPYAIAAIILNIRFINYAWLVYRECDDKISRKMFGFSIIYLMLIFAAMLLDGVILVN